MVRHVKFSLTSSCKLVSHDHTSRGLHKILVFYNILGCSQFGWCALRLFIGTERRLKHLVRNILAIDFYVYHKTVILVWFSVYLFALFVCLFVWFTKR